MGCLGWLDSAGQKTKAFPLDGFSSMELTSTGLDSLIDPNGRGNPFSAWEQRFQKRIESGQIEWSAQF
ncbi:hypothetical protein SHINM1_005350 [Fluviibacter phosphoraccumulans]|nr:hypothetical protein SHINM1_005350 [Fluviibacter phosphoraccumulans]